MQYNIAIIIISFKYFFLFFIELKSHYLTYQHSLIKMAHTFADIILKIASKIL